jgi:spore germination cell wall hydrolase CwlJ-like protein
MGIQKALAATLGVALMFTPKVVAGELDIREEIYCLARNIYFESRNQPQVGRVAVGQVTMNRVNSPKFPNTVCEVVKQARYYPSGGIDLHSCQFSWYCDGKSDAIRNQKAWDDSMYSALFVYSSDPLLDIVDGALWYHATYSSPAWAKHFEKTVQINEHIFYKERK